MKTLLRLHITLCNSYSCFFFFFLVGVSETNWAIKFSPMFHRFLFRKCVTRIVLISLDTLANGFLSVLFILEFSVCEQDMPCVLEINSRGRTKQACGILLINIKKHYISTNAMSAATRLEKVVTQLEGLLPIKSNDPLLTLNYEITWQNKKVVRQLLQYLWSPNLPEWWLTLRDFLPRSHLVLQ